MLRRIKSSLFLAKVGKWPVRGKDRSDAYFLFDIENGHLFPMHWLLNFENSHIISGRSISTSKFSLAKSIADRIERNESLLQHRGPPILPISPNDFAVIW